MSTLTHWFSQVCSVTQLSLQTIPERKGSSAAAAFGIAGVVAVLVGVLSIAQGFRHALTAAGDPGTAIVMRSGATSEMMSGLARDDTRVISDAPGVARGSGGPLASPELFVIINLPKRSTGTDANVPLRGVEPAAFGVHEEVHVVEGRRFEPGKNEVLAGAGAAREFAGLTVGQKIRVANNDWTVVGIFTANGGISESEVWTDASVLQGAYRRGDSFQSVYAKLASPNDFQKFKDALTADPRLNIKVVRQPDYYAEQSTAVSNLVTWLGTLVAGLMGVGAIFGALNTMYNAVAARTREIATLRALGFGGSPIIFSVLFESLALAVGGGAIGAAAAYLAFDGFHTSTMNFQSFSQVAFSFRIGPNLLAQGIFYAALIGLVGGLFPAIRAVRLPVATALREL